jgi:DEAD/DEAH box helicase domain-containing protein
MEPSIGGNITSWRTIPFRKAKLAPLPDKLHPALIQALNIYGIHSLFAHQSQAWNNIQAGHNTGIVTGTASGKTLCYNLPVIDHLLRDLDACALYIFPTKALSQDQYNVIDNLLLDVDKTAISTHLNPLTYGIYDGDTPRQDRSAIRKKTRLLISNPDMLHAGILPHHIDWARYFRKLRFLVIDEMHMYRGVFGSHVANVIRRLKRITKFYGSNPQFILTSATIANPKELAEKLIEEDINLIDEDGSALGSKYFLIYNPPVVDQQLGIRRSALHESVRLAEDLITYNVQTIIFAKSRRTVEIILTYLRESSVKIHTKESSQTGLGNVMSKENIIRGYRSGYLPLQRREIERGLRQGYVRTVVATNALELGIDIGGMGATLIVGYPGTIAATWQQAGRSGRGNTTSLTVLVATADPLDQFFAANPNYFFERSPEHALINPDNLLILLEHLRCATFELPFKVGDTFGQVQSSTLEEFLIFLQNEGTLHKSDEIFFWMTNRYPAQSVSLRNASASNVILQSLENGLPITIGEIDQPSAYWMVHPGAVYLHEGNTYAVKDLDLDENIARLIRTETDYYTEPRRETTVQLLELKAEEKAQGAFKAYGDLSVLSQLIGFRKIRWFTHENLGVGEVSLPPTELITTGYWLTIADATVEKLREEKKWSVDPNNYGPEWKQLRNEVRKRDNYQCQVCGLPESDRSHDVHHKTPFRSFQSHLAANRLENLVTLCPRCHRRVETVVRVKSGLSGIAFVLKHISPLFLMCDTRDIGVHSDPKSPITNGKATIVLYDQIPAGIGLSQRLYELHDEIMKYSQKLVSSCECSDGCPSCVGPGGEGGSGGKQETLAILEALNGEFMI